MGFEPTHAGATILCLNHLTTTATNLARPQGLEPRTLALEGRCSIQLSYERMLIYLFLKIKKSMVGVAGFEPATLWSQTKCATKLRYTPSQLTKSIIHE